MERDLKNLNQSQINLKRLGEYLKSRFIREPDGLTAPAIVVHYFKEITRFWNKLNFVVKKTLRSIKSNKSDKEIIFHELIYFAYRYFQEGASYQNLIDELTSYENPPNTLFKSFFEKLESFSWEIALEGKNELEKLSIIEAAPSFFIEHLKKVMNHDFLRENIKTMNDVNVDGSFTVFIKQNIEKVLNLCFINNIQKEINADELIFQKDDELKNVFHVPNKLKSKLIQSELYQSGDIIIVDKGSVLIIDALNPQPNDFILDLCAAPGIKSFLISEASHEGTRIIAGDFSQSRTNSMRMLLNHLKATKVNIINADGIIFPSRDEILYDKILLDAPCTGSGTFLSNPELKWRQNEQFLNQNTTLQEKLLRCAIELLKPGGILIYSTCSFYPEEGEQQILKVFDKLEPLALSDYFSKSYQINGSVLSGTGRLFPSIHGTQGFFIGKFKKK